MRALISAAEWSRHETGDEWRHELPLPEGVSRLQLIAVFPDPARTLAPRLDLPGGATRNRAAARTANAWIVHEDLPYPAPPTVVVVSRLAPDALIASATKAPAAGISTAGLLPRSLASARTAPERSSFDVERALELLKAGDLDKALAFGARLCLAGETARVAAFASTLADYLAERPLQRSDGLGMFVAALSGLRGEG